MSEPRRKPARFAWLLPLAVFVLVLLLMPSENERPRKLPFITVPRALEHEVRRGISRIDHPG